MRILLTNDDGIYAPGIIELAHALEECNHEVIVVAPEMERSASSHSITLHTPLRIIEKSKNRFAITGSPADCVILALEVILDNGCDLVISGINNGPNMGEDILYSGTVAAAIEAMYFGYPAIAVSLNSRSSEFFPTAAQVTCSLLRQNIHQLIQRYEILNINIPSSPLSEVKGYLLTKTGHRRYKEFVHQQEDPRGRKIYWIGGDKPEWLIEEETDIAAVANSYVSITPVSPRFTNYSSFDRIQDWLRNIETNN
ncbi:MAG: 5'/3'-nucleotidase SurE [Candidatus Cloacimonetes bacterium]|nr:5'/3'-nucleotidase SurE [Candidatus Cloacimonadota bacterium]